MLAVAAGQLGAKVRDIRWRYDDGIGSVAQAELAAEFGVSARTVIDRQHCRWLRVNCTVILAGRVAASSSPAGEGCVCMGFFPVRRNCRK